MCWCRPCGVVVAVASNSSTGSSRGCGGGWGWGLRSTGPGAQVQGTKNSHGMPTTANQRHKFAFAVPGQFQPQPQLLPLHFLVWEPPCQRALATTGATQSMPPRPVPPAPVSCPLPLFLAPSRCQPAAAFECCPCARVLWGQGVVQHTGALCHSATHLAQNCCVAAVLHCVATSNLNRL